MSCKVLDPVPDPSNYCKCRIGYSLACSDFLSCVVTKVEGIRNSSDEPEPSEMPPELLLLHHSLLIFFSPCPSTSEEERVGSEGKFQLTLTRTQGEMALIFTRRKSSLFSYYIQLGSCWLSSPLRCSDRNVLRCGTSQEGLLSGFRWRQLPWR